MNYSRCAVMFPSKQNFNPRGPIPRAIIKYAKANKLGMLFFDDYKNADKYDKILVYHNRPDLIPHDIKANIGWWMCDLRPPDSFPKKKLDNIFLCNTHYAKDYAKYFGAKVFYCPQTGHSQTIKKGHKRAADIVFIGNVSPTVYHSNRKEILQAIEENFNLEMISGDHYTINTPWIYYDTPISLAISPQAQGYTSNRLYNILASKGFCLTLYFPGIEKLFENHKHLVWFKTKEEAVELIKFYLKNPDKRDIIRAEGYKLYKQKHSYIKRLDFIFNNL